MTPRMTNLIPVLAVLAVLAVPCVAEEHDHTTDHHEPGDHDKATRVRRSTEDLARFGITVEAARPGRIDRGIELLGEIRPNDDTVAHIVPRFPGIALTVRKTVGDETRSGDVLATIQSNESLAPFTLSTMIDGTVIEKHLTRGEAVDRDKPAFVIADLRTVWVDLSVYQKDLHRISVGQAVRVSCEGVADAEGSITYVSPIVDQPTRTTIARVVLPNPDRNWRPGLFVTARVLDAAQAKIAIPRSALQTIDDQTVVFVETADGFVARRVVLARGGESSVEVISGLAEGERYAATNSFLLKADLGKGTAEHEH